MTSDKQADGGTPILIFDGDCGFCTVSARWIQKRLTHDETVVAWQSLGSAGLDALGLSEGDVTSAAWWADPDGTLERGHRAIGRALLAVGGWKCIPGWGCLHPPSSWLASVVYRGVVRWRHLLPGSTEACRRNA